MLSKVNLLGCRPNPWTAKRQTVRLVESFNPKDQSCFFDDESRFMYVWFSCSVGKLRAQIQEMGEMQLMERVAELQRQLESAVVDERESAERELLKLGPAALDHLEPATDQTPTDAIERLGRVRIALEKIAVASVTKSSKVTLKGTLTVDQALAKIRKQTGNDVDLPDEVPDVFAERKIELDLADVDFWAAIADIARKAELVVDPYAGRRGQLRLTPTQQARIAAANPNLPNDVANPRADQPVEVPQNVSGVFDLTVTRVNASRNLRRPELNYCNVTVLVRWEPRIQPVSIDLPIQSIKAVDEFDNPIEIPNPEGVISGTVQPDIPELEFSVPIGLVDRQIEVIKSFDATIAAVLPGRIETFKFKNLNPEKSGLEQRKAGAIVTFDGIRKNDDLYGVTIRLSFEDGQNALESHQGWAFENPIYLLDEEGKQSDPIAFETLRQDDQQVAVQYYFVDDPKGQTLIYKSPAAIVEVPVKISLKNIPLP